MNGPIGSWINWPAACAFVVKAKSHLPLVFSKLGSLSSTTSHDLTQFEIDQARLTAAADGALSVCMKKWIHKSSDDFIDDVEKLKLASDRLEAEANLVQQSIVRLSEKSVELSLGMLRSTRDKLAEQINAKDAPAAAQDSADQPGQTGSTTNVR